MRRQVWSQTGGFLSTLSLFQWGGGHRWLGGGEGDGGKRERNERRWRVEKGRRRRLVR
jgi:hypothetical protein